MAEKHKSKYKRPENAKYKSRKDLKDYTLDDKDGKLNPKSTGEKLPIVLRKTDKETVDTGDMYPKYKDDDRLYKDLSDADYDPKTALNRLKKRQNTEADDVKDVLADKIENLTREQRERLVREYVRRKISKILIEQTTTEEPPAEEPPAEEPAIDPTATDAAAPAPDMSAAAPTDPTAAPAPDAAAPAPDPNAAPAPAPAAATAEPTLDSTKFKELGNIKRIGMLSDFLKILNDADLDEKQSFYHKLRKFANNEYVALKSAEHNNE